MGAGDLYTIAYQLSWIPKLNYLFTLNHCLGYFIVNVVHFLKLFENDGMY